MNDTYYIVTKSDYTLPSELFCKNTPGKYRESVDTLKTVVHCTAGCSCLDWKTGSETAYTHSEILTEMAKAEWTPAE